MTPVTPAQFFAILVFVAMVLSINFGIWRWSNRRRHDGLTLAVEDERERDDTADDLTIVLDNRKARFIVADYGQMAALPEALYEEPGSACTCPWNNGYFPGNPLGHHVACPALTGHHTPDDACQRTGIPMCGHRDGELVVDPPLSLREERIVVPEVTA